MRQGEYRESGSRSGRRWLARILAAMRYDLSWRFAPPGAFRQRFEQAIASMPQGICLYDAHDRLQLVNEQFCRIYNQPMTRLRTGMTLYDVLADSCAIGNYPGRGVDEIYGPRKAFIDRREKGVFLQELGDGRLVAIYHQPLEDGGWVCTYEDITERRRAEARIEFLAHYDGLTELPNRVLFTDRLNQAIVRASPTSLCSLMCLDLDGFKGVNDKLGHAAGDVLLQNVAMRLQDCIRANDTPARLGGDEFAIVLPDTSPTEALRMAHHMASILRKPYFLGAFGSAEIAASIGIAFAPDQASTGDELLLLADRALYRSKNARKGFPVLFDARLEHDPDREIRPTLERALVDTRGDDLCQLASDLADALRADRLELHYQPIYDAQSGSAVVFEALARWNDPVRGAISPLAFVKAAEEYGLIGQLTEWVLTSACREAACWNGGSKVSVNLSPRNLLDPLLVEAVEQTLADNNLAPSRLVLELTEGSRIDWCEAVIDRMRALRRIGIELWLDDFGVGYANFHYFQHLLCDVVKVDRSFLAKDEKRRELLGGMISLVQACGLRVAVEGVESTEHHDLLKELGCDLVQGYLFARPMPPERLRPLVGDELPFLDTIPIVPAGTLVKNQPLDSEATEIDKVTPD